MKLAFDDETTRTLDDLYESIARLDMFRMTMEDQYMRIMYEEAVTHLLDIYVEIATRWNERSV